MQDGKNVNDKNQQAGNEGSDTPTLEDLLRELEQDEDSGTPESIGKLDAGDSSAQGAASHEFAKLKKRLKQAVGLLQEQSRRIESMEGKSGQGGGSSRQQDRVGVDPQMQEQYILMALRNQALTNLGIASEDQAPRMFQLELNRLYNEQASLVQRRAQAKEQVPRTIDEVLGSIPQEQLTVEERAQVKQEFLSADPVQVTASSIRNRVAQIIGEKVVSGTYTPPAGSPDGDEEGQDEGANRSSAAAASSGLRSTGSPGVKPGGGNAKSSKRVEPPTPEERVLMKKLKISDVSMLRKAQAEKHKYAGR